MSAPTTQAGHGGHEAHSGHHAQVPALGSLGVDSRKLGVWAFIGSEALFFAALITIYLVFAPVNMARSDHQDPKEFLGIAFTTILAAILLASSLTMVLALAASKRHDWKSFRIWHLATAFLGLCFLGGQVYEFQKLYHEGVTLSSSLFGTTFFVLTGFHGTHVAIGVIWLMSVFLKVSKYPDSPENPIDIEIAGLYWHFVDLVWTFLFPVLYLL